RPLSTAFGDDPPTVARLFFFSSRRRHTISKRDWSSDVCSSDLAAGRTVAGPGARLWTNAQSPSMISAVASSQASFVLAETRGQRSEERSCRGRMGIEVAAGKIRDNQTRDAARSATPEETRDKS